jgi:hypothetical protein
MRNAQTQVKERMGIERWALGIGRGALSIGHCALGIELPVVP